MSFPTRTTIRLPRSAYKQPGLAWLVSITTHGRQPLFAELIFGGAVAALLIDVIPGCGVDIDLYCIMPDHIHVVAQVTTGDLVSAIQAFKSHAARLWIDWEGSGPLWQRSFHERGLRSPRDYQSAVEYVFANPVEAGLAERWELYPLIGGRLAGRL